MPGRNPTDDEKWKLKAACRGLDPNLFFPVQGHPASQMEKAQSVCAQCRVNGECDEYAERALVLDDHTFPARGTWAGRSEKQRKARRRRVKS